MKYSPSLEILKEQGDFDLDKATWGSCGYCDTVYYLGRSDHMTATCVDMPDELKKDFVQIPIDVKYAVWWVNGVHLPRCAKFREMLE